MAKVSILLAAALLAWTAVAFGAPQTNPPPPPLSRPSPRAAALCYTQAASAGARMIQALRSGILILVVPPTFMSVGMILIVYRKRNQFRQADDAPDSDRNW